MLETMKLFFLVIFGAITRSNGNYPDLKKIEKLLIHNGSSDTFENRLIVKNILDTINRKVQRFTNNSPPALLQKLAKKKHIEPDIPEINKDIISWLFQGDILLTPEQAYALLAQIEGKSSRVKRGVQTDPNLFWNPAVAINYTLDSGLSSSVASLIEQGIRYWQDNTCLSFTKNANGYNRLRFYSGSGCSSYIGRQPTWESQDISIGSGCNNLGTVTHEIGHALSLYHTQSRYDRDDWLTVDYSNIVQSLQYNFVKASPQNETHFNKRYDYGSVMQYNAYAFARDSSKYTLIAKNSYYQDTMGQREAPAFSDVREINLLYNCSNRCTSSPQCRSPGYVDPRNCNKCKCPRVFAGDLCDQLPKGSAVNCNGAIVQANSQWNTLNGQAGDSNSYSTTSTPTDCYWHIAAPQGSKIQVRISQGTTTCPQGCTWQIMEINLGYFDTYGMLLCCANSTVFTSNDNLVTIRGTTRYNALTFKLDFRSV